MTVTVFGVFQSSGVNVTDEVEAVPSARSPLTIEIVTFAVGSLLRTISKLSVPPASVTIPPRLKIRSTA